MKIEFLDDISRGGQFGHVVSDRLVRLFDFDMVEVAKFQSIIRNLIENENSVAVDRLPFIKPINCSLTLSIHNENLGIVKTGEEQFDCRLTKESYEEMISLIQPFVEHESDGYQWLYDTIADIDFLFSPGGTW